MSAYDGSVKLSLDSGNRSSIFFSPLHDKRNLWWRAFRKTVLEPCNIVVLEDSITEKVPEGLLCLVEEKRRNLQRHEEQALTFLDAVAAGRGFGSSPIFPPDVVPALPEKCFSSRCLEPIFDQEAIPSSTENAAVFEFLTPRPGLVSGFAQEAFTEEEFKEIPQWLTAVGTLSDYTTGQIWPGRAVYSPYLLFERTYGNAKHEIESSTNYCAMGSAAALNGIKLLFDHAQSDGVAQDARPPVVFSCIIDNELGIINHHWIADDGKFHTAPLCKFDFRAIEHFMHFLAWVEAIEEWANDFLLPDIRTALGALVERRAAGFGLAKALPSPVTDAEKQEKLSHSMRLAFENIPWKGERFRNTPLGVTGAMRMRSPKVSAEPEPVVTPMQLSYPGKPASLEQERSSSISTTQYQLDVISPVTVIARSPAPDAQIPPVPVSKDTKSYSKSTPNSPAVTHEKKKERSPPTSILSIKSAGLLRSKGPLTSPRPETSAEPQSSKSTTSSRTVPLPRPDNSKSPGIVTSTVDMKSPSRSIISIASKKSFMSLRSAKSVRSPDTPENNVSPRERGFKSKISSGLGAIKEHARPKRPRTDNSAPSSAKDGPLPTPAYDKKRFEIRPPPVPVPDTPKFWADQQVQDANPATRAAAAAAYNANHVLPFRQYAKNPTVATVTTTITAGGS
ncbi:hypothetical protein OHC33_008794 [Knufia fluminis]|uniref:DUF7924 domain-containing protein n=1 Tax=Knufia fluminis TaxID=191047 RepID=A0AAN8E9W7_9EURO|nr:hypothetical protein OHC33_008794 [Knufia fluminis]